MHFDIQELSVEKKQRGLVIGNGQLGEFIRPYVPATEIVSFDLRQITVPTFPIARLARNITRSNIFPDRRLGENGERIRQVVIMAVPETVFARVASDSHGKRSRLFDLLGVSGAGCSQTMIVFLNSVHQNAAAIFDGFSGPTFGLHLMFRPGPDLKMSEQSAVITVSDTKRSHHFRREGESVLRNMITKIGIGNVVTMSSIEHDWLMADIQFLSHSLYLTLADFIENQSKLPSHNLVQQIRTTIARILKGKPHVYSGIAQNNPFNRKVLRQWRARMSGIKCYGILRQIADAFDATEEVAATIAENVNIRSRSSVSTPISRARRCLAENEFDFSSDLVGGDIHVSVERYYQSLQSEHAYNAFFNRLARTNC